MSASGTASSDSDSVAATSSASVTDVTLTSTLSSVSSTVITETSTVTAGSTTYETTTETTSLSTTIVSSIYVSPSTTYVAPSTTSSVSSVVEVTSFITLTPSTDGGSATPTIITVTSFASTPTPTLSTTSSVQSTTSSSRPSALNPSGDGSQVTSSGLTSGGKIAIAVVIPIAAIALAFIFGLIFFKKRQKRKAEEAMRQKEMADYSYNPNNDTSHAPVGVGYVENGSESADETSGYRGWGNTSSNQRKPSTTMGSGNRGPAGMAMSESSSNPGGYGHQNGQGSDQFSGDTAMNGHGEAIGAAPAAGGVVGLGAAAATQRRANSDINRGPSNASSAYTTGHAYSDESDEAPVGGMPGPYYHEEVPYNIYNEPQPNRGLYGEGAMAGRGGPPIIQNVGAKRDTRIERVPTFPQQQGNPSIAQNF